MKKSLSKRAFTLIELLIVIGILAILIAIAIPSFTRSSDKAQKTADEANRRVLKSAAITYYSSSDEKTDTTWNQDNKNLWGDYLEEWPENPTGEESYTVTISSNGDITITPELQTSE